jgi:hypothetical protein
LLGVSEPWPLGVWIDTQVPAGTFYMSAARAAPCASVASAITLSWALRVDMVKRLVRVAGNEAVRSRRPCSGPGRPLHADQLSDFGVLLRSGGQVDSAFLLWPATSSSYFICTSRLTFR